ncbi:MAG: hypothetical protein AVDCRST_MAG18-4028 [uncultured Thermomicrobiales bacterium]|uniref:Uncharacterized protein n=1 Tax=uncultured Thermomicrobiales bacterium TaxID=1645740 RepID=A0A6J4VRY5_9BACT|nr:MAG: hypothetical protein AVDCRST_MAG18-4028 [uncultured Thermomicrobiales bacterium]
MGRLAARLAAATDVRVIRTPDRGGGCDGISQLIVSLGR